MSMKLKRRLSLLAAALLLALSLVPLAAIPASADEPLDRILNYDLTITPRDDATLDMVCHIRWKVLDSDTDGPLTWVKLGVPNHEHDDIKEVSANIDRIEDYGDYLYIYLDREYKAGEVVDFTLSWHQGYMFRITGEGNLSFAYTPGWFDEIPVDSLTVTWDASGALSHDILTGTDASTGDTVVLTAAGLAPGAKVDMEVVYPQSRFPTADLGKTADEARHDVSEAVIVLVMFAIIFAIVFIFCWADYRKYHDKDYWTGGFEDVPPFAGSPAYRPGLFGLVYYHRPSLGTARRMAPTKKPESESGSGIGGGHGGGGCACACACACAGGGRAGCSRKNILSHDASRLPDALPGDDAPEKEA